MQQGALTQDRTKASAARCAVIALLLSACNAVEDSSPTAGAASADPSPAASTRASASPSHVPTGDPSRQEVYVHEAGGWSIVVPSGWEVLEHPEGGADGTLTLGTAAIAWIFVLPSSGLTLEQLAAQKVEELSTWPEVDDIEAEIVRLPAGQAVRVTISEDTTGRHPAAAALPPFLWVLYVIEEGERQYSISIRSYQDDVDRLAAADALAESFAISGGGD